MHTIEMFLDEKGRIRQLPSKGRPKHNVLAYLATKFFCDRDYTEKEVNTIIEEWHTFGDYFVLRRELIDHQFLCRTRNGARYWKEKGESEKSE